LLLMTLVSFSFRGNLMTPKLHTWMRFATLLPACLLAACGGVRLQSLSQATQELSSSVQRDARQDCQKSVSTTDYMACTRQVDRTFDQFRQEQQKQKPPPIVIQRPPPAAPDASAPSPRPQ
jgi:hypothetical protein